MGGAPSGLSNGEPHTLEYLQRLRKIPLGWRAICDGNCNSHPFHAFSSRSADLDVTNLTGGQWDWNIP